MSGEHCREYLLFPSVRPRSPLVMFLHGTGATAAWADDETGWSRLAALAGFVLAVPEALRPDPDSPPKFLTNPQRWNDGSPTAGVDGQEVDDVAFLANVIEDAQRGPESTLRESSSRASPMGPRWRSAWRRRWRAELLPWPR